MSWQAHLRRWYWQRIRRWDAEICQECGRPVRTVWWCHDDMLWEKVTGKIKPAGSRESASGIMCMDCFDELAREVCVWIEWAPVNLRHMLKPEIADEVGAARWAARE